MLRHRSLVSFFGPALAAGSAGTLPARQATAAEAVA